MNRAFQGRLFILNIFLLGSVWWIYSTCFIYKLQENVTGKVSNMNEHHQEEIIANGKDIKVTEAYSLVNGHFLESSHKKQEKDSNLPINEDQKYIDELKELLQGDALCRDVEFETDFLRQYVKSNHYNIDEAFTKILNLQNLKINHSYFFHNISFDFTQNPAYRFITLLPGRRKDGSATFLFEIAKWNPDVVPLLHLKQIMFMGCMQELRNPVTQWNGLNIIYDLADVGFRYAKYASPENLQLLNHVAHEVLPVIFVGIHLINLNFFGRLLVTVIRPFIPLFIEKIFYVHSSADELLDFFPSSMLPVQYGGNLTDYYMADWIRKANEQHGDFPTGGQKNIF